MNEEAACQYWNSEKIVDYFTNCDLSEYWFEFFSSITERRDKKVLDAGCGGGRNLLMLHKLGYDAEGCDLHENMVLAAQKNLAAFIGSDRAGRCVVKADIGDLPYADAYFDYILSNGVLHNVGSLPEFEQAVIEIARTLRTDGILALNIFSNDIVDADLQPTDTEDLYLTPDNLDMLLLSKENILRILGECGLLPITDIVEYSSAVFTGDRSVVRGLFEKKINQPDRELADQAEGGVQDVGLIKTYEDC